MNNTDTSNKNLDWFKRFIKICKENDIWYVVDNGTLLGAARHGGPIPWDDDFDVCMTLDSYLKLKSLFPDNCIDGDNQENYPLVIPKFIPDKSRFLEDPVFVDIFLITKANEKTIKKYRSLRNKMRFMTQCVHSTWKPYAWYIYIWTILSWPFHFFVKKITYIESVLTLNSDTPTGYYTIDNPVDPVKINFQKSFNFNRKTMKFLDFEVYVPEKYNEILTNKYSSKYMVPQKDARPFIHTNAVSIRLKTKEEIKECE